jgi:hypothetical protein
MNDRNEHISDFAQRLDGRFVGVLRWEQLEDLWEKIGSSSKAWYMYQVGSEPPSLPMKGDALRHALQELDQLLRADHEHDYCGIVYADRRDDPTLVKVYDPNNLGFSCGSSGLKIPPRWIISLQRPTEITDDSPTPKNRQRWWQRLFGN